MKKIISIILIFSVVGLIFAGCRNNPPKGIRESLWKDTKPLFEMLVKHHNEKTALTKEEDRSVEEYHSKYYLDLDTTGKEIELVDMVYVTRNVLIGYTTAIELKLTDKETEFDKQFKECLTYFENLY
jgi:hypothetical protein